MRALVTGSSGHLGEALVRTLRARGDDVVSLDMKASPFTTHVGSITDPARVREVMKGADVVFHAATLHKPHVATHARQAFVDVNVTGTLTLLEEARRAGVSAFIFTSTTSVFGHAMTPEPGGPATWITEDVTPKPKNIYGVTKLAAEQLCGLFNQLYGLPCLVLRTARFFPEDDDNRGVREAFSGENAKVNELLHRRADIADMVGAHLCAAERAVQIGFGTYIISATTPFTPDDLAALQRDAASAVRRHVDFEPVFAERGWAMFETLDRVYVNAKARAALGWAPQLDFAEAIKRLSRAEPVFSALAAAVGAKGYHDERFEDGPYPIAEER